MATKLAVTPEQLVNVSDKELMRAMIKLANMKRCAPDDDLLDMLLDEWNTRRAIQEMERL